MCTATDYVHILTVYKCVSSTHETRDDVNRYRSTTEGSCARACALKKRQDSTRKSYGFTRGTALLVARASHMSYTHYSNTLGFRVYYSQEKQANRLGKPYKPLPYFRTSRFSRGCSLFLFCRGVKYRPASRISGRRAGSYVRATSRATVRLYLAYRRHSMRTENREQRTLPVACAGLCCGSVFFVSG